MFRLNERDVTLTFVHSEDIEYPLIKGTPTPNEFEYWTNNGQLLIDTGRRILRDLLAVLETGLVSYTTNGDMIYGGLTYPAIYETLVGKLASTVSYDVSQSFVEGHQWYPSLSHIFPTPAIRVERLYVLGLEFENLVLSGAPDNVLIDFINNVIEKEGEL